MALSRVRGSKVIYTTMNPMLRNRTTYKAHQFATTPAHLSPRILPHPLTIERHIFSRALASIIGQVLVGSLSIVPGHRIGPRVGASGEAEAYQCLATKTIKIVCGLAPYLG